MTQRINNLPNSNIPLNILLVDKSNNFSLFERVLKLVPINTRFARIANAEKLAAYLSENSGFFPDLVFFDVNPSARNIPKWLIQMKPDKLLKNVPVIVYAAFLNKELADILYSNGVYYYVCKTDLTELQKFLHFLLSLMIRKKFLRPTKDHFIINGFNTALL